MGSYVLYKKCYYYYFVTGCEISLQQQQQEKPA